MDRRRPLICRACQKRIGMVDAQSGVCSKCSKKLIGEVFRPAYEIMRKPYSLHPGDAHLEIVLATWGTCEWVVWMYNKQSNSYGQGNYWISYERAVENYYERGDMPLQEFSVMTILSVLAHSPRKAEGVASRAINTLDTNVNIEAMMVGKKSGGGQEQ